MLFNWVKSSTQCCCREFCRPSIVCRKVSLPTAVSSSSSAKCVFNATRCKPPSVEQRRPFYIRRQIKENILIHKKNIYVRNSVEHGIRKTWQKYVGGETRFCYLNM